MKVKPYPQYEAQQVTELEMIRTCVACGKCCKHIAARNNRTVLVSCSRCHHTAQGKYRKEEWVA